MPRKTYNEKLHNAGGLPKIEDLSGKPESVKRFGGSKLLVAAPLQYNERMAAVPLGQITTAERLRAELAAEAGANATCPLTAGIFINICAHAAVERGDAAFPWWRTLKAKGELNEKFPPGQREHLKMEGHTVIEKGNRLFVVDCEK
ncbi:MAG: methylated DNA-protein cysteine methyltransferase [Clostridiales bacterium]|nr:methylated DNA-protein cysteine methyltransferase [Clostridiales bacterium]